MTLAYIIIGLLFFVAGYLSRYVFDKIDKADDFYTRIKNEESGGEN